MQYKTYSTEYKIAMINEYFSRDVTLRSFADEKDIGLSTFESWLTKYRKLCQIGYKHKNAKAIVKTSCTPMEVTNEVKTIINEETIHQTSTFILETNGMKMTFSLSDLKTVLGVINNG